MDEDLENNSNEQLITACQNGELGNIKELVENGADVRYKDNIALFKTSLFQALELALSKTNKSINFNIIEYLVEKGADVNSRNGNCLTTAFYFNNYDLVDSLIKRGADIELTINFFKSIESFCDYGLEKLIAYKEKQLLTSDIKTTFHPTVNKNNRI